MAEGDGGSSSRVRQRRPIIKRRRTLTRAERAYEREAQENFKQEVLRLDLGKCVGSTAFGSDHECDGPLQAHHAIKQAWLRTYVSTLDWPNDQISDFLWDPNVGATLCRRLHDRHTSRFEPVPPEWLPNRVTDFANAYRLMHILEREHPPMTRDVPPFGPGV